MFTQIRNALLWGLVICLTLTFAPLSAQTDSGVLDQGQLAAKIDPVLLTEVQQNGRADFFIWFQEQADLSQANRQITRLEKGQYVFDALRQTAERSQREVRAYLDAQGVAYRPYYVANAIVVYDGDMSLLADMTARAEVVRLLPNRQFQLEKPMIAEAQPRGVNGVELNISFIRATEVWDMGVTGDGAVLAGGDTGIQWNHPALINHYRGWDGAAVDHNYNWWDATGQYPLVPNDGHGHGTHISGTMVGDDGGDNRIGVAPGAQVIHCKNMTDDGSGDDAGFMECFEWVLAPWDLSGQNPMPSLAPHAMNNSWGYWGGGEAQFITVIENLHAAGILVEVSAGNEGPDCGTLRSPSDYDSVLTTGSVSHFSGVLPGGLTDFSSRGPSSLYPDAYIPTIMAPGEAIRSSLPGGAYEAWSGTSMAGPHATALVGLMWSANPALAGMVPETMEIIKETAVPLTGVTGSNCGGDYANGPNNDWGWGTIDAYEAVVSAIAFGGAGTLEGVVLEADTEAPIAGAAVRAAGPYNRLATTNASGGYRLVLPEGVYDISVSKYGYVGQTVTGVDIVEDETLALDFSLEMAAMYNVSGVVADANTGWPLYARVNIVGFPYGPVWTDPLTGAYSVELAGGFAYTFNVSAWVDGYLAQSRPVGPLDDDATIDFALDVNAVSCAAPGYYPIYGYFEDFEKGFGNWTTTGLWHPQSESDACGGLVAPFPSPENAFYFGDPDMCSYDVGYAAGELTMATPLTIPAGGATLAYWSYEATECDGNCGWDMRYTEVSVDGGANWTTVGVGMTEGVWHERRFDLSPFADQAALIRFRFDSGDEVSNAFFGWLVDDVGLAVGCEPQPGSLVVGNVYDANTGAGLNGAQVSSDLGPTAVARATPLDNNLDDGFYTLFAPAGANLLTASRAGYQDDSAVVVANDQLVIWQSFELTAGYLQADPDILAVDVIWGDSLTTTLDLLNLGAVDAQFELTIAGGRFEPTAVSIPANEGGFPRRRGAASLERAPLIGPIARDVRPSADIVGALSGAPAYAMDAYPGEALVYFFADTPDVWDVLASVGDNGYFTGDFVGGNFDALYLLSAYANELHTINVETGAIQVVGPATPIGDEVWTGMTAAVDGTVYAASTNINNSTLYTLDVDTGQATVVGAITNAPCIIDIAITPSFEMYGLDICSDMLVSIDPETGAGTIIGYVGFDANFAQGMDFEEESGVLYLAAFNDEYGQGELRIADVETGATALVGVFPNGAEVTALGFATFAGGVSWLTAVPESGLVLAENGLEIEATFNAADPAIDQPGIYNARLRFRNDTPYGALTVPVIMNVLPTETTGKIAGLVTTSGYCDTDPQPLAGAAVLVESYYGEESWYLTTNADGYYQLWLDQSYGPVTVTVMREEYETQSAADLPIVGLEPTTADFELRWLVPCVSADPDSFSVELDFGDALTHSLTLLNEGGGATYFQIFAVNDWYMDLPWLSTDPDYGEIEADSAMVVEVLFDADQVVEPGLHLGYLYAYSEDPVNGVAAVPISLTVNALPTTGVIDGWITSPGYCDANPVPVAGATVLIESSLGKSWMVQSDADGYYYRWLDEAGSPFTLTVMADSYAEVIAEDVVVVGPDTTTTDFDIRWLAPCLTVEPTAVAENVLLGEEATVELTITNHGGGDANLAFFERGVAGGQPTAVQVTAPAPRRDVPDGTAVAQSGLTRLPARSGLRYLDANPLTGGATNVLILYADDDNGEPLRSILLSYPDIGLVDTWAVHHDGSIPPLEVLQQYEVVIVWGNYYYIDSEALGDVLADYADGDGFVILSVFNWTVVDLEIGGRFADEGYNPLISLDWGNHFSEAYLGDYISDHPIMQGVTYVSDYMRDIVAVDLDAELVASWSDGEPFVAHKGNVVAINSYTGAYYGWMGDVGMIFHNAVNFLISGVDLPWLSVDPAETIVPADGSTTVEVTLSALPDLLAGRTYNARLILASNDPVNARIAVPTAMYVVPPESYGLIAGSVVGLGYCDAEANPLANAQVWIESESGESWSAPTDADGRYFIWVNAADSPYMVATGYADHEWTTADGVMVVAQETTAVEFALRWLKACLSVDPAAIAIAAPQGGQVTLSWTLRNAGAGAANFIIREKAAEMGAGFGRTAVPANAATNAAPDGYRPSLTRSSLTGGGFGETVAIFKDFDAWGVAAVEQILDANEIPYEVYGSDAFAALDFQAYKMIVVSGDQPQGFYDAYADHADKFATYVVNGGFLSFLAADNGWNGGLLGAPLPGGVVWNGGYLEESNLFNDPDHPVAQGVPDPFYGYSASHGHFSELPEDAHIIASEWYGGMPTIVAYGLGAGQVAAYGQPLEIAYEWGWDAGLILVNGLLWGYEYEIWEDIPWLSVAPDTGAIDPDGSLTVSVTFDVPEDMELGDYLGTLVLLSNDPFNKRLDIPVLLTVATFGVEISSATAVLTGQPGHTVHYALTITNTGTTTDSLVFTGHGHTWDVGLPPTLTLGPGESAQKMVAVMIPATAAHNATDMVVITATSLGHNAQTAHASLTTTAFIPTYYFYFPIISKP